jgi:transcriptional regulator with XRE-family HTH domain
MSENDRKTGQLTAKQRRAIDALLQGQTKSQAATAAGVTPRTLSRWLHENVAFSDELTRLSKTSVHDAARRLTGGLDRMLDVLLKVAESNEESASVRIRAALGWLNAQIRLVEQSEIVARLDELEAKILANETS